MPSYAEQYCYRCSHWKWTNETVEVGYCAMYSCTCATAILNHTSPTWFRKAEDAKDLPKPESPRSFTETDIGELYRKIATLSR